jgi:predicted nucleic-acid-binding protein
MRALDTNVLARFFLLDPDDVQAAKQRPAAAAAMAGRAFVSNTVLLEFEWVMRGFYDMPKTAIARVLRALLSIEHISFEDRSAHLLALHGFEQGLDFADALHLSSSSRASEFATFDRKLAKRAKALSQTLNLGPPVELLV